jgi:uncharacterized membrane protein
MLTWTWLSSQRELPYGLFALALLGMALALGAGVEIITLKGDIARMNTVFKFYLQAWVLLGAVSAYFLWRMDFGLAFFRGISTSLAKRSLGVAWIVLLSALLLSSSIYTVAGTQTRLRNRFQVMPLTLNGLAYMADARYIFDNGRGTDTLHWDYEAIQWLRGSSIVGSPVILEGQGALYRTLHDRVSIYTGLPTVLGWDNHQSQQRGYGPVIGERIEDIRRIYSTTNTLNALQLLGKYRVEYIYVGELERHYYPERGLEKFQGMVGTDLELVYSNPGVQIYRVLSG